MDGRRSLSFSRLDEVMPEVDRLLLGHRTVGRWTLGQICNHLADSLTNSVDGVPFKLPWVVRKTVGPFFFRRMLRSGKFPEGAKMPARLEPRAGLDARAEAEALRAAVRFFQSHQGPFADHPLAGPIDREAWSRFHAIHSAHHLAFAVPEAV